MVLRNAVGNAIARIMWWAFWIIIAGVVGVVGFDLDDRVADLWDRDSNQSAPPTTSIDPVTSRTATTDTPSTVSTSSVPSSNDAGDAPPASDTLDVDTSDKATTSSDSEDTDGTEVEQFDQTGNQVSPDMVELVEPDLSHSWNGETWVVLSWLPTEPDPLDDVGSPENFEVRFRLDRDSEWTISTSETTYQSIDEGVSYGYFHELYGLARLEKYVAQVRECDGPTCSEWANHEFITEKPVTPAPDNVEVVELGSDSIVVEWDEVPNGYSYTVMVTDGERTRVGRPHAPRYESGAFLEPRTEYTITVSSCIAVPRSGGTYEIVCGPTDDGTTITVTTPLVGPDLMNTWHGETWVILSWLPQGYDLIGDDGRPEDFEVQYRLASDSEWTTSTSEITYENAGYGDNYKYFHETFDLIRLEDYVARVRRCDEALCSTWSEHSFTTERDVPPAPEYVHVVDLWSDFFELEWDAVPSADSYDVTYFGGDWVVLAGSEEPRYVSEPDLEPGTRYTITVRSCNDLRRYRRHYVEEACGPVEEGTTLTVITSD